MMLAQTLQVEHAPGSRQHPTFRRSCDHWRVVGKRRLSRNGLGVVKNERTGGGSNTIPFMTSCRRAVQPQFSRAVALMHSFQFSIAIEAFDAILVTDPSCSVAYWGIA